jgi:hypothetical protein
MSQASTPAVVGARLDEEHVVCCTMDTQSMLMSQLAPAAVVPEHYGRRTGLLCAALWTQSMLMSPLALRHEEHVYLCYIWTEYADVSANTPAVVPSTMARRACLPRYGHTKYADVSASIRQ